jgi:hypothetical protein
MSLEMLSPRKLRKTLRLRVSQFVNYCFKKCRNFLGTISRTLQTDVLLIKLSPLILEQLFGNRQLVSDWDIILQDTCRNSTASKKN